LADAVLLAVVGVAVAAVGVAVTVGACGGGPRLKAL
jgi:hypothetical protein